jgi:hypothetical protein
MKSTKKRKTIHRHKAKHPLHSMEANLSQAAPSPRWKVPATERPSLAAARRAAWTCSKGRTTSPTGRFPRGATPPKWAAPAARSTPSLPPPSPDRSPAATPAATAGAGLSYGRWQLCQQGRRHGGVQCTTGIRSTVGGDSGAHRQSGGSACCRSRRRMAGAVRMGEGVESTQREKS